MTLFAYSIFDRKGLIYHAPFFAPTDGHAIRSCADLAQDNQTTVGRHPGDFTLYKIGSYDDQKGFLAPISPLSHVVDIIALVPMQPQLPISEPPVSVAAASNGRDHTTKQGG